MNDMQLSRVEPGPSTSTVTDEGLRNFMLGVYRKLALGLLVSGAMAWIVGSVPDISRLLVLFSNGHAVGYTALGFIVLIAPLFLLLAAGFVMRKPTPAGAGALYWAIVALIGASLGTLFFVYTGGSLASTFLITAAAVGGLSLWGYSTARNLSGFGAFLYTGLIGLIIAMVVNLLMRSPMLYFVTNAAGVLIFSGLIAWDTNRLKVIYSQVGGDEQSTEVAVTYGALSLFIDFVNLFQFLLAFSGQRQR